MNCKPFRVTVCELPDESDFSTSWERLLAIVSSDAPDLLILPELPFSAWFCGAREPDQAIWTSAVSAHEAFDERIASAPAPVIFSAPINTSVGPRNVARISGGGLDIRSHAKSHLPNEEGYWEACWYDAGNCDPEPVAVGSASVGVQLCTEMWDFRTVRNLGASGADILAIPRTTPLSSSERWICGGRAAAISAGAYCLSSNRSGPGAYGSFSGAGWVIDPDGEVMAVTSQSCPIVTCEIDLEVARRAKSTYPRYAI